MKVVLFFMLLVCLKTNLGYASEKELSGTISLGQAISKTLANNPKMSSFKLRNDGLQGLRLSESLKRIVSVNANVENVLGSGDVKKFSAAEVTLSLSQIVELGDKRNLRVGVVDRRVDLLLAEQRVLELDLLAEVTFRFINLASAQERLLLQQQASSLAQQTLDILEPLVIAGQTPRLELVRAKAALSRTSIAEHFANMMVTNARIELSSMWASQRPQFSTVQVDFFSIGEITSLATILMDLEQNSTIAKLASEKRVLDAQVRQAAAQTRANIQWTAGIKHLSEVNDTGLVFGFSMPLSSRTRASGNKITVKASRDEVEAREAVIMNQLRQELHTLHQRLKQAIFEVVTLQQDVLPLLTDSLSQMRQAYQTGAYRYEELVSAQQEYLDAELSLINSATKVHIIRTDIERLSGQPLGDF